MHLEINGNIVLLSGPCVPEVVDSYQFRDWVRTLDPNFELKSIDVCSVYLDTRGDKKGWVRYIKFKAQFSFSGTSMETIVFMRGGSVAILVILECEGEEYTILTIQPRFPSGSASLPEIPAGTIEEDATFAIGAARELEEETGIVLKPEDLIDLTRLVYGDRFKGVFSTPGGSDEFLRLFLSRQKVTREYLADLQGKCTGLACENERITLRVIKLHDLVSEAPDVKALSALSLYRFCQAKRLL